MSVLLITFLLAASVPGLSYAQSSPTAIEAGITPDSPFYGLDVFFDDVSLALTFDAQVKATKAFHIASERLEEAKVMALKMKITDAENAKREYEKSLAVAAEASQRVTKSDAERELEEKVKIEFAAEAHEQQANAVSEELKLRLEIEGSATTEQKQALFAFIDALDDSAADAKLAVVAEKEKIKLRIEQEKGKSKAEVETEEWIIEKREGVDDIKREKAEAALADAAEEIGEAVKRFRELYGFDAGTENVIVAISEEVDTAAVSDELKQTFTDAAKRVPVANRVEAVADVSNSAISDVVASTEATPIAGQRRATSSATRPAMPVSAGILKTQVRTIVADNEHAHAAAVLIKQAMKHYAAAKRAFAEGSYGNAYGQAVAAKKLAENANRIMSKTREPVNETNQTSQNLTFETIEKGAPASGGELARTSYVIHDEARFNELWSKWFGNESSAPDVNFSQQTVIAVFAGAKPSGGYSIEVTRIYELPDRVVVVAKLTTPSPDTMAIQVITYPFHIVKTEKITKPVTVEWTSLLREQLGNRLEVTAEPLAGGDNRTTRVFVRKGDVKMHFVVPSGRYDDIVAAIAEKTGLSRADIDVMIKTDDSEESGGASGRGNSGSGPAVEADDTAENESDDD